MLAKRSFILQSICFLIGSLATSRAIAAPTVDPVLDALVAEMTRSSEGLKGKGDTPLYYLSYRVRDGSSVNLSASYGALDTDDETDDPLQGRFRALDVSVRVGSPQLDNTHKLRKSAEDFEFRSPSGHTSLPVEDDVGALRMAIWRATDQAYKAGLEQIIRVKANVAVKVADEAAADDFDQEPAQSRLLLPASITLDRKAWGARLKRLSAFFKDHPMILHSSVSLQFTSETAYFVDSDGARIREPHNFTRLMIAATVKADDGMNLNLYKDLEAPSPDQLPPDSQVEAAIAELIGRLEALRVAPVVEPYAGPAIVTNRAAAVFFHEIFGHRVEGHRQKDADEGHTFTRKVGKQVVPPFISVADDPTIERFGPILLNGHYAFDDEGVPAQRASLVENGVLKSFLMGRSPIQSFPRSNGHGRAQTGRAPVARQGNLIVSSTHQLPFAQLRQQLIDEVKRQHKPYGLVFEDISGGFTNTRTGGLPQAFKVLPLVVKRVYPDGRPDELVRGVDLVGTPLQSFENILATGDDFAVFNGVCGAESGWVPVSAVAPSLLIGDIEVERREKSSDRFPLLPPPLHPEAKWPAPDAATATAPLSSVKESP